MKKSALFVAYSLLGGAFVLWHRSWEGAIRAHRTKAVVCGECDAHHPPPGALTASAILGTVLDFALWPLNLALRARS